jgi:cell division protein ZapA
MELINISIKIADRDYPLKIKAVDESKIKNAADKINQQLKDLMNKYDGRDMQDFMAMHLLIQMNQESNASINESTNFELTTSITKIESELEKILKS